MYVNMAFAIPAAIAASRLLVNMRPSIRPRVDLPGVIVATSGLFALVCGFASAEMDGWGAPLTSRASDVWDFGCAAFIFIERRSNAPLLPLHVVGERNRGAAFLAVAVAGVAMFSMFLFLTYYLQQGLGFSPIESGLAYLPMVAAIMITAPSSAAKLLPRTGPRPLIPTGMGLAALGLAYLTGIEVDSSFASAVLPGIIVMGVGFGLIMAPSFATATHGVAPATPASPRRWSTPPTDWWIARRRSALNGVRRRGKRVHRRSGYASRSCSGRGGHARQRDGLPVGGRRSSWLAARS